MSRIRRIEESFRKQDLPEIRVGDTVDVHVLIREGEKERIQIFNGTVIRKQGSGMGANYTVRRIVQGQGVERIFPLNTPSVQKVEVKRSGRVRQSRLYYLRDRTGKATRLREIIQGTRAGKKSRRRRRGSSLSADTPAGAAAETAAPAVDPTPAGNE
jgi:large subunit ribosomal protein L19